MELTISIVHHKNLNLLDECLASIFNETKETKFEVIVVDNLSNDGVEDLIKQKYPSVKIIKNDNQEGFAKNHNKVIKIAKTKYILILNDDTVILDSAIDKMMKFMNNKNIGIIAPKMIDKNNNIQRVGYKKFPTPLRLFFECLYGNLGLMKIFGNNWVHDILGMGTENKVAAVSHVNGACMLIRKEIGFFDENYFMFVEETDLCYRAKNNGWQIFYYPEAKIIHYGGSSLNFFNPDREKLFNTSVKFFIKKYYGEKPLFLYQFLEKFLSPVKIFHKMYLKIKYKNEIFLS